MFPLLLVSLTGCDALFKARDTLDGLLDPIVAEGLVLGVEAPTEEPFASLYDPDSFAVGTTVTLFMADATEVGDLEQAPITGAMVSVTGPGVDVVIPEQGEGLYAFTPADGVVPYGEGDTWTIEAVRVADGEEAVSTATITLPPKPGIGPQVPAVAPDGPLVLDLSGGDFDNALVIVFNEDGVTYSNEPTTIREVYDFTHGDVDLTAIEIPASAFADGDAFLVGVAGMVNTRAADLDEMNTALSTVMAGDMEFAGMLAEPLPEL